MTVINASDYSIKPNNDITCELFELLDSLKNSEEEKVLRFEQGTYYIDSQKCRKYMLCITNTTGDNEYAPGETPHLNTVPFYFNGIKNLVLDGDGSVFLIDGKTSNIAIENCSDITLKNIEIRHLHPDMHELEVIKKGLFSVEYKVDGDSDFFVKNNKLFFTGKDYCYSANKNAAHADYIGLIQKENENRIRRVRHPLRSSLKIKDLKNGKIRVRYLNTSRFKAGDKYCVYDVRRQFVGIFIGKSTGIVLENIKQRFNYSLALVAQDSENISLMNSEFCPEPGSERKMASAADFIQICMCRGKISVIGNTFCGAGDDCMNVHGIHFKITAVSGNNITVKFMHPQTHGFNPFHKGDIISFISPDSLLEKSRASITCAELIDEYEIGLTLDSGENARVGDVIDDISAAPDVDFMNNTVNRIITRGLLLTTGGKVNVSGNRFISTSMSGILISDDAKNWYESGMCRNVTVKDNIFDYCGETPILIKPENVLHNGAVHRNITIDNNVFDSYDGYAVVAKSTENIIIKNNRFNSEKIIDHKNCDKVFVEHQNEDMNKIQS